MSRILVAKMSADAEYAYLPEEVGGRLYLNTVNFPVLIRGRLEIVREGDKRAFYDVIEPAQPG